MEEQTEETEIVILAKQYAEPAKMIQVQLTPGERRLLADHRSWLLSAAHDDVNDNVRAAIARSVLTLLDPQKKPEAGKHPVQSPVKPSVPAKKMESIKEIEL